MVLRIRRLGIVFQVRIIIGNIIHIEVDRNITVRLVCFSGVCTRRKLPCREHEYIHIWRRKVFSILIQEIFEPVRTCLAAQRIRKSMVIIHHSHAGDQRHIVFLFYMEICI